MDLQLYGYSTLEAGFLTGINYYALKDGVCFGPHALTPGFMESRNRRVFVAQIPLIRIIVTLFSVPKEFLLIKSKKI